MKKEFPSTKTVLGVSNVSFGLPPAGREVLNSVFLFHCTQAGLDMAIVNAEKLERYASIPPEEKKLAEDLLFNCTDEAIAVFTAHFRDVQTKVKSDMSSLPVDERLSRYIIEGTKEGLNADLNLLLQTKKPLEIINGPLMRGMDEVGRLFNNNELIVAEVLQSAEAMKAAVGILEPFMDKLDSAVRGKVILATVKGDVHDIGKNLVDIILTNNGFNVINLGIKIQPEVLINAIRLHKPDIVGLSGLLVKSAQQMVITANDMTQANLTVPMMVGGAALTDNFTNGKIAPAYAGTVAYASDAMSGLELAKQIVDPERFEALRNVLAEKRKNLKVAVEKKDKIQATKQRSPAVNILSEIPQPLDFSRHVIRDVPVDQIWNFVNPRMLFGRHLGVKGGIVKLYETGDERGLKETDDGRKLLEIVALTDEIKKEWKATGSNPRAIFQFFEAASEGNTLFIYSYEEAKKLRTAPAEISHGPTPLAIFDFPRQAKQNGLCLADYASPLGSATPDNLAFFVVTAGEGIRDWAEKLKNSGQYLKSHVLQALALETAEAFAEYLHSQIRRMWGFGDPLDITMMERFQAKYRGKRYSFGYPACPVLDDQGTLFKLLNPADISVELTEGFMMDPEASVSALVFHHPAATYFGVGELP